MINKANINSLFNELNDFLAVRKQDRELTIYGGAALIALDVLSRVTHDIDIFQPKIDELLLEAIHFIGKKNKLGPYWLNSTGQAFVKELPGGWRKRVQPIYKGSALTVSVLGRSDLIFTKILAELDRQEDMPDLIELSPTRVELESIEEALLRLEKSKAWHDKVNQIIKALKKLSDE